jgi:hypothetical protein
MHAKLQLRACNVISRMALGKSFDELSAITNTSGSALFGAVCESLQLIGTSDIGDLVPALRFLDIQRLRKRSEDTFRKLDSVFQSIIDERRRRSRSGAHCEENDLLDSLLQLLSVDEFSPRQLGFREESIKAILWVRTSFTHAFVSSVPKIEVFHQSCLIIQRLYYDSGQYRTCLLVESIRRLSLWSGHSQSCCGTTNP